MHNNTEVETTNNNLEQNTALQDGKSHSAHAHNGIGNDQNVPQRFGESSMMDPACTIREKKLKT